MQGSPGECMQLLLCRGQCLGEGRSHLVGGGVGPGGGACWNRKHLRGGHVELRNALAVPPSNECPRTPAVPPPLTSVFKVYKSTEYMSYCLPSRGSLPSDGMRKC
ncbi:hypothetical protein JZ751_012325 [Albula glossodonta]|uniref:Uncharacterized protein n=1 Tax=Albula glossodonta TaxID=121402 RepID=A0A8T2PSD4_9TELE|nr:hypothetical protein JZ751_012325 [Albula glossodonta]